MNQELISNLPLLITSVLTTLGIGGILGAYFSSLFQHRTQVKEHEHELKRKRYGSILIFMLTKLDTKNGLEHIKNIRPDIRNEKELDKELKVELLNGILFANDDVIKSLTKFIEHPSYAAYTKTAIAMRKDLWGKKTSITEDDLKAITR